MKRLVIIDGEFFLKEYEIEIEYDTECPHQEDGCDNCKLGRDPIDCQDALRDYLSEME